MVLFGLVIALGFAANTGHFREFDIAVSNALNLQRGTSPDWLISLMYWVSWIGGGVQRYIIVTILTVALWRWWGRPWQWG
jgi:undecaprenyl-diphosphatase